MTRRAASSPSPRLSWHQNVLLALGMGAAVVLLGCGGGGGGGGNNNGGGGGGTDACADNTFSGQTVICGYVIDNGTNAGVNGANVAVKTAAGTTIAAKTTYHNNATGKDGYYVVPVTSGGTTGTLIGVTPPSSGFLTSYLLFNSATYDVTKTAVAGGPCIPAIPSLPTPGAGNVLPSFFLFPDSSTPPPPVFTCPR